MPESTDLQSVHLNEAANSVISTYRQNAYHLGTHNYVGNSLASNQFQLIFCHPLVTESLVIVELKLSVRVL